MQVSFTTPSPGQHRCAAVRSAGSLRMPGLWRGTSYPRGRAFGMPEPMHAEQAAG